MSQENIKALAKEVYENERLIHYGKNVEEAKRRIEDIISSLPLEELIMLDDMVHTEIFDF